jgi:hypothetical protein
MSHRDKDCRIESETYAQEMSCALEWLLGFVDLKGIGLRDDCRWSARALVATALLWACSSKATLGERLIEAIAVVRKVWKRETPKATSYQAFLKLLNRWTRELRLCLMAGLKTQMERTPKHFRIRGFLVLAGDGSKVMLCRTESNQDRFSPKKARCKSRKTKGCRGTRARSRKARAVQSRQKKADSPQMALTALYHVGMRMPWDWRIGPGDSSERAHLQEMAANLPPDALLTCDCGFVGYDFWAELLRNERNFVIRVGGNVRLLKCLGTVRESAGIVYLWPDKAAKGKQPPLVLRLVVLQGERHPWYLVTSVLDPKRLSDRDVEKIYCLRWGIELFFRHFKQTFGRSKLRSHTADNAECEAEWSLLGLWAMLLYAQQHLPADEPPRRMSVARVLRAFGKAITHYKVRPEEGESLTELLAVALIDKYKRKDKRSRGYPRKKYEPQAKKPRIKLASDAQRKLAQEVMAQHYTKG